MQVRAIALSKGAELLWIRVGKYLDPIFGHRRDETVESITPDRTGFKIQTVSADADGRWSYGVDSIFVSRLETTAGEVVSRPFA